jgi:hypothetical protein
MVLTFGVVPFFSSALCSKPVLAIVPELGMYASDQSRALYAKSANHPGVEVPLRPRQVANNGPIMTNSVSIREAFRMGYVTIAWMVIDAEVGCFSRGCLYSIGHVTQCF